MGARGVFAITRKIFDHRAFKDEPFTEREAWMWMIGEAAWQPTRARVGRAIIDLRRSQFAHSVRFMGKKWQWTESRVRRFLERLKNECMIDALPSPEATVITICKYDDYQFSRRAADAPTDELPTHRRRREEETEESKNLPRRPARAREGTQISAEASVFVDELALLCGQDPKFLTSQWVNAQPAVRAQMWLDSGWRVEIMRQAAKTAVQQKRDGPPANVLYFEKIFARAHAPQLPLPPVPIASKEHSNEAFTATAGRAAGFTARSARRAAAHAALKHSIAADEASETCEEGGGQIIRLDRDFVAHG